jgi:hypothetical protein
VIQFRLAQWVLLGSAVGMVLSAPVSAEPRAVVELFTSQGCSSCPKADKLLGELAQDRSLIAMSLSVDYWDYLGWKDTLALPAHTARQRAYARGRGDRQVYTPQAVVNGALHALGSDKSAIERAVQASRRDAGVLSVPVKVTIDGAELVVDVAGANSDSVSGEVWLCPVTKAVEVAIERGENRGRSVIYHNVVRRWVRLGEWTGRPATWRIPLARIKAERADEAAIVVQGGSAASPGKMLGASVAALH